MKAISHLIQSCLDQGIREFVVCAGARNMPLVQALGQIEDVWLWSNFEERSAAFFALGRTMSSMEPCAVLTTSGTAVAELLPAVIEAHYQRRPLVILSADRPDRFRNTGAPQAIDQVSIFSNYVEGCVDIAEDSATAENYFANWSGKGPWHINICIEEKVEVEKFPYELSPFQPAREQINVKELVEFLRDVWTGVVVCIGGLDPADREEVYHFVKDLKAPVVVDSTSGLRETFGGQLIAFPEQLFQKQMVGKVLRIGEVPVGRYWRDLEESSEVEVLSICRSGYSGLARESKVIKGDIARVLKGAGVFDPIGDVMSVLDDNSRNWALIDELLEAYPDSEPGMVRLLSQYTTMAEALYLGNSLPIREWNQFAQRDIPQTFVKANRGANGIDGQVSTWLGLSADVDDSWCVVGDLTALYDMTALSWLTQVEGERRVLVVINNGGGKIFDRLPLTKTLDDRLKEVVQNNHQLNFGPLAEMWGVDYRCIKSSDDLEIEPTENPLLIEVVPSAVDTEAFWEKFSQL